MRVFLRFTVIISLALLLALTLTLFTRSIAAQSSHLNDNTGAAFLFQSTSTPQPTDQSEIGSTDGIIAMGGVIVLIVVITILMRRRDWTRRPSQ